MSVQLTEEQRQALAGETPLRVVDPVTNTTYVLLREDDYQRLQGILGADFHPSEAYPAVDRAFAEGWNDPKMDDYDRPTAEVTSSWPGRNSSWSRTPRRP